MNDIKTQARELLRLDAEATAGPWGVTHRLRICAVDERGEPRPRTGMRPTGDPFPNVGASGLPSAGEAVFAPAGTTAVTATPLAGGFRFSSLMSQVDAAAVLALEREEMVDLLLTSHWDQRDRSAAHLQRLPVGSHVHLFAKNARGEGFFLVWNGPGQPSVLNRAAFRAIATEAGAESLTQPFHVYARTSTYSGPNVEFYQIPNRILDTLGFNEAVHPYGLGGDTDETSYSWAARYASGQTPIPPTERARPGMKPTRDYATDEANVTLIAFARNTAPALARAYLAVCKVLEDNGCDCDCEHHPEEHDDDCVRCLACRVELAMLHAAPPAPPS